MKKMFKKLLMSLMLCLTIGFVHAQDEEKLNLVLFSGAAEYEAGYGVPKDFIFTIVNFGDDVEFSYIDDPGYGEFMFSFSFSGDAEIDFDLFELPEGLILMSPTSETDGIVLTNEDGFVLPSGEMIEIYVPVRPNGPMIGSYNTEITVLSDTKILESVVGITSTVGSFDVPDFADPLPVNFLSFVAQGNDCTVDLKWTTSNETKTGSFAVERSSNGANYSTLAVIDAITSSAATLEYAYTDEKPLNGTSFYRIRQIDIQGKETYSQARMIYGECDNSSIAVYPNPATDYIVVEGSTTGSKVVVYNVLGQIVISKEVTGSTQKVELSSLPAGSYTLNVVQDNNIVFSGTVIKR
jgi:hypothetical protein